MVEERGGKGGGQDGGGGGSHQNLFTSLKESLSYDN